jgi:hypothetical protein
LSVARFTSLLHILRVIFSGKLQRIYSSKVDGITWVVIGLPTLKGNSLIYHAKNYSLAASENYGVVYSANQGDD